jgi:hypothetical protein
LEQINNVINININMLILINILRGNVFALLFVVMSGTSMEML